MGVVELIDKLLEGRRLFQSVEVFPMKVFDQRLLETMDIGGGLDQDRHRLEPGAPGGSPPSLTGDQFVIVVYRLSDQDRLEHANFADAGCQ